MSIEIFTRAYSSQVKKLEPDLYLTLRSHRYHKNFQHTETFGPNWLFIFADLQDQIVELICAEEKIYLRGRVAIFVPEFCILSWRIPEGVFSWQCLSSSATMAFPKELLVFPWENSQLPQTHLEIKSFLHTSSRIYCVNPHRVKSKIALETKCHIDLHYKSDLQLQNIAGVLDYHRIHLSREFKKTFGLSMVEYRHQLRIYESLKQMNKGASLTEAIFLSGYSSLNQFISYFKRYFLIVPSYYNFNKPKIKNTHTTL